MKSKIELLSVLVASVTLAACGGGGGGGTAAPAPAPAPAASTIVTSVPAATYAAASGEALAYTTLNAERSKCGFGLLAQSARLDQAAAGHLSYMAQNNVFTHTQEAGKAGYTGVQAADRAIAAGYGSNQVGEIVVPVLATDNAEFAARRSLSGPYHGLGALDGNRDIGLAWGTAANFPTLVVVAGVAANTAKQDAGKVLTYPCDGSTGVLASTSGEVPTPFPAESGATWGQPILVKGASDLRVAAASITGPGGSVAIKAIFGDGQATDPNAMCRAGAACVMPVALAANTAYSATVSGTNAGAPFTTTFGFRTGAK